MKKIVIASLIALSATAASALEMGVTAARDFGSERNSAGVTLGERFGAFGVTGGFDRSTTGDNDQSRWSLLGSYQVTKVGPVELSVKAGFAYLENGIVSDGGAALVGVGAEIPVFDQVKATLDYSYQRGQSRVRDFNGNRITAGLKYSF